MAKTLDKLNSICYTVNGLKNSINPDRERRRKMKDRRDLDFGSLTFKDVAEEEEERGVVFPENADTDERLEDTIIPATGNLTDMMAGDYSGEDEDGFDIFVHHGEEKKMRMRPKSKEERGKFIKKTSFAATVRNKRGCITGVSD